MATNETEYRWIVAQIFDNGDWAMNFAVNPTRDEAERAAFRLADNLLNNDMTSPCTIYVAEVKRTLEIS
jgi:hypothetical protein